MNDHLCLFNTAAFYGLRGDQAAEYLRLDHHATGRLVGSWVGGIEGTTFISGWSAPFSGPDFVRDDETISNVTDLIHSGIAHLAERGIEQIELRLKPPHYGEAATHVLFVLFALGFQIAEVNINYMLPVRTDWQDSLKKESRKALRHSLELGLIAESIDSDDEPSWEACYEVLRSNRTEKGRPMRLPLDYIRAIRDAFPGMIRLTAVSASDGQICAAALIYRIAPGRDIVQYWGDAHHSLTVSPMPALVEAVVKESFRYGASTLDLGISTDVGKPNVGLMQFKRNMGAKAELRFNLKANVADVCGSVAWNQLHG